MGCDMRRNTTPNVTPSERIGLGSYHDVHRFRKLLVFMTARHYLKNGEPDTAEEAMGLFPGDYPDDWAQNLPAWTSDHSNFFALLDDSDSTDYSVVSDAVRDERLEGLRKFVDHSDCDGWHSRGDVVDIAALFEQVQLDAEDVLGQEDRAWFERIARFFIAARDAHEFITYC